MIIQRRRRVVRRRLDLVAVRRLAAFGFRLELATPRRALRFIVVFLLFPPISLPESLSYPLDPLDLLSSPALFISRSR
jgi:hypothetical protein